MTSVAYGVAMPASRGVLTPQLPPWWLPAGASIFADIPNGRYWAARRLWPDFAAWLAAAGGSFSGAAGRTYTSAGNLLATAGPNVPRITFIGGVPYLLYEPAATNRALQSNLQSGWSIRGATLTQNAAPGADGLNSAALVAEDTTTGRHMVFQGVTVAAGANIASIDLKPAGRTYAFVNLSDPAGPSSVARYGVNVDLTTATITMVAPLNSPPSPVAAAAFAANGFVRVSLGFVLSGTTMNFDVSASSSPTPALDGNNDPTYPGDGASGESISGIAAPGNLTVTFDDASTQSLSSAAFAAAANLNRAVIAKIAA